MTVWVRSLMSAALCAGLGWLMLATLSPSVWAHDVVQRMIIFYSAGAVGSVVGTAFSGLERTRPSPWVWLRITILFAAESAAIAIGVVVLARILAGENELHSTAQQVVFACAVLAGVASWVGMRRERRIPPFTDEGGEERREQIRANIRREIEEIERSAKASAQSDRDASQNLAP